MVDPAKGASTPPVDFPARKIMRRDDGKSGTNTAANSQNPSKTTSEVGGSAGSNDGDEDGKEKDLKNMTREQREARYREARQRIFGKAEAEEAENADLPASGEDRDKEKDTSRSSSANGKKKNKKQRNYDDDDFQARSHFNAYYPGQYAPQGYNGDNVVYYSGYAGPGQNPQLVMNPGASPQAMYSSPYPTIGAEAQGQLNWSGQQYPAPNPASMMYGNYNSSQNGYDLSADFQRGMSSFQNANLPSQTTPKMGNVPMAGYQDPYHQSQHMGMNPGWVQMSPQQQYTMGQGSYGSTGPGSRPMSASQNPMSNPYPYGQFPTNPYNGKPNHNQHPIPGSYNRQQFNPQSQAFVPGGRMMPGQMQPNIPQGVPQMNGYWMNGMNTPPNGMPLQMPRMVSSATSSPPFGSPQSLPGSQGNSVGHMPRNTSQTGEPGQSSIAKYGTPAHLPAKPPPPASTQQTPPKLPPVARPPNNMVVGSS